ncbi:MAG: methyltransferase domain-containing protein [Solirubrobacterales bacterium]
MSTRVPEQLVCPICGGGSRFAFEVGDRNRGLGPVRSSYQRCEACGTVFVAETPDDLGRYYEADGYGSHSDHFVEEFVRREQAKVALVSQFAPAGRMVEVGPGSGMFARAALRAGFDYQAVEMDARYCRYLTEELGVQAINSDAPAEALSALPASQAIVMWHVIEHLPQPTEVLRAACENLADGGVLAISTPNPDSLQFRLLGRYWAHLDAPRHLQLIPHAALLDSLARLGMRHVQTTTTDPVGLECNRMGWEYAIRRHPARRASSATSMRSAKLLTICLGPVEQRRLLGAAYTSLFVKGPPAIR